MKETSKMDNSQVEKLINETLNSDKPNPDVLLAAKNAMNNNEYKKKRGVLTWRKIIPIASMLLILVVALPIAISQYKNRQAPPEEVINQRPFMTINSYNSDLLHASETPAESWCYETETGIVGIGETYTSGEIARIDVIFLQDLSKRTVLLALVEQHYGQVQFEGYLDDETTVGYNINALSGRAFVKFTHGGNTYFLEVKATETPRINEIILALK
jgi:hypothetical protein